MYFDGTEEIPKEILKEVIMKEQYFKPGDKFIAIVKGKHDKQGFPIEKAILLYLGARWLHSAGFSDADNGTWVNREGKGDMDVPDAYNVSLSMIREWDDRIFPVPEEINKRVEKERIETERQWKKLMCVLDE